MKRLIAFVLLLSVGLAALKFAIGDDVAVRADTNQTKARERDRAQESPPGVRVDNGKIQTTVSQSGKLVYPRRREVDLGGGATRKETVYILRAEDSRPIGDGVQQLTGVRLELFDDNRHAATVLASRAFLELGRDANGQPRIEEQKEVDLRDTVVTGEPGGRLDGMRLQLGDAKVKIGDDEIQLITPADQRVELQLEGERSATLTGSGARTRLPRSKSSSLQQVSVTILSDPLLEAKDVKVRAKGRLNYVEDLGSGVARITLDEDVELDLERGGLAIGAARDSSEGPSRARGDQFLGWLLRSSARPVAGVEVGENRGQLIWQRLRLAGAPATIDLPGVHVATPRITVRPGPLGDPCIVTAHGGASRVEQTTLGPGNAAGDPLVGRSPQRIHLIRPGDAVGALHRAVGFPRWTMRPFESQQLVVFMGPSELVSGSRTLRASKGLLVTSRADTRSGIVKGAGEIEMILAAEAASAERAARPALEAVGSDGLILTVTGDSERAQLGPAPSDSDPRWRQHRYELSYGEARVSGLGTCDVFRSGDRTHLSLGAPFDEIAADFGREGTELRRVRELSATLEGERLRALDVGGLPIRAVFVRDGERLVARAPRLRQIGPRSLQLLPTSLDAPPWNEIPEVERTPRLTRAWRAPSANPEAATYQVEVRGPRIDVHHAGGRAVLVDTFGDSDQVAQIYAVVPQAGSSEPATVRCAADRLRVLPFVVTPEATAAHFGGGGTQAGLAARTLARPWLLVDQVRAFELDDEQQGHVEGTGRRMLISQGSAAALFIGDPDDQTPAIVRRTHEGRDVELRGARVRVRNEGSIQLSALGAFDDRSTMLSPTLTLREPGARGLLSHMSAICRGDIHVEADSVRFTGPVEAAGLLPDGAVDPDGLQIDARKLQMQRQPQTGQIAAVVGQDVRVDWTRLQAQAERVKLDLLRETCVASDPTAAVVTTPDGRELRARRISVNYLTWEVSSGPSSARSASPVVDPAEVGGR